MYLQRLYVMYNVTPRIWRSCIIFCIILIIFPALDAMRKAYEEELEQEKEKYRYALKTMFTDNYVDDIRRRHE